LAFFLSGIAKAERWPTAKSRVREHFADTPGKPKSKLDAATIPQLLDKAAHPSAWINLSNLLREGTNNL
jgi:hypothetical protein